MRPQDIASSTVRKAPSKSGQASGQRSAKPATSRAAACSRAPSIDVLRLVIRIPKCYNLGMGWRRLNRWAITATIALYVAAAASLAVMLGENLSPEGSSAQLAFRGIAGYLVRLGDIGGGTVIATILLIMIGGGTGVLLFKAYDQYQENKQRRAQERAQWRAEAVAEGREEGRKEGREEGRKQGREQILNQFRELGIDVDELLSAREPEDNVEPWLFP